MSVGVTTLVAGTRTLSADVRSFIRPDSRTCGHIADRQDNVASDRPENRSSDLI